MSGETRGDPRDEPAPPAAGAGRGALASDDERAVAPSFLGDPGPRLVLFGGKGGVGKTTTAAATALLLARRHPERRVLALSTDPAHSLRDAFALDVVPGNLELRELDARARLEAWRRENGPLLGQIAARGTTLRADEARELLGLPLPGEDEVMALLELADVLGDESLATVVVDTAPAGHTLLLLALPRFLRRFSRALDALLEKDRVLAAAFGEGGGRPDPCEALVRRLERDAARVRRALTTKGACELVLVTSAEPVVLEETLALRGQLRELEVPVEHVVVNRLTPPGACPRCSRARAAEEHQLLALVGGGASTRAGGLGLVRLERLPTEARGLEQLERLGAALGAGGARPVTVARPSAPQVGAQPRVVRLAPRAGGGLVDRPLLVVGGKGGVGKTTLAVALARHLAATRPHERLFLYSADPARTLSKVLGVPLEGEVELAPGLVAAELDAPAELARFRHRFRHDVDRVFGGAVQGYDPTLDREAAARLVDLFPPGLAEVMAVLRATGAIGRRFERVVLDTAPAGHLLRLLQAPQLARTWARTFSALLRRLPGGRSLARLRASLAELEGDADRLYDTLRRQAALIAVSVPTALGHARTAELLAGARRIPLAPGLVVVNRLTPSSGDCSFCVAVRAEEDAWASRIASLEPGVGALGIETAETPFTTTALCGLGASLLGEGPCLDGDPRVAAASAPPLAGR